MLNFHYSTIRPEGRIFGGLKNAYLESVAKNSMSKNRRQGKPRREAELDKQHTNMLKKPYQERGRRIFRGGQGVHESEDWRDHLRQPKTNHDPVPCPVTAGGAQTRE